MNHYADRPVRARIAEFFGAESNGSKPTAVYFATADEKMHVPTSPRALSELATSLQSNLEIFRSLWDRQSLLVDLDIEYVNFDDAAEPYIEFERTFALQEPLRRGIQKALLAYGIAPLHLLSGRGHHFIWRIGRDSACFARLAHLGRLPTSLQAQYKHIRAPGGETIDPALGKAFVGLGQVVEYFAAEMKRRCAPESKIPIELSAIEVGPGEKGRELISFDISQYGDPLPARFIRAAYSRYLKILQHREAIESRAISNRSSQFVIPIFEMDLSEAIRVMHNPEAVVELATYVPAKTPDCTLGTENLLNSYLSSELALFHGDFYATDPEPPERWPQTYNRIDTRQLPSCMQVVLQYPNDFLFRARAETLPADELPI
jgi:hypothetical protein